MQKSSNLLPGYMLLAGRVRQPEEEQLVIEVIENNLKCKIDPDRLFSLSEKTPSEMRQILERFAVASSGGCFGHVVWTRAMCRMAVLVAQALKFKEPVLLVGETGQVHIQGGFTGSDPSLK